MDSVTQHPQKINVNLHHVRCPGCYSWRKSSHFVWVPAGLIDEKSLTVCISCALTIRHAFTVLTEKAAKDAAAVVCNAINYIEMGGCAK
jgi:hypothetical protein